MFFEAHLHLEYPTTSERFCGYINNPAFVLLLFSPPVLYICWPKNPSKSTWLVESALLRPRVVRPLRRKQEPVRFCHSIVDLVADKTPQRQIPCLRALRCFSLPPPPRGDQEHDSPLCLVRNKPCRHYLASARGYKASTKHPSASDKAFNGSSEPQLTLCVSPAPP